MVCKTWRQVFEDNHPLKFLQRGDFNPRVLQGSVSAFAKNLQELEHLNTMLGPWMDRQIKRLSGNASIPTVFSTYHLAKYLQLCLSSINSLRAQSNYLYIGNVSKIYDKKKIAEEHKVFILENLLLTTFNISTPCTNEEVKKWINVCKSLGIKTYNPSQHFQQVVQKVNPDEIPQKTWEEAFRLEFLSLCHVPKEQQTQFVCLAAVKQDGLALQYVPETERTQAIYLAAIKQNISVIHYIPETERTQAVYLVVVKQNGCTLQYVPETKRTPAVYLAAVTQEGWALQYVPETERTQAVCLAAVTQNRLALHFVPKIERTQAVLAAGKQNREAL